jgi:hypothetical protein
MKYATRKSPASTHTHWPPGKQANPRPKSVSVEIWSPRASLFGGTTAAKQGNQCVFDNRVAELAQSLG